MQTIRPYILATAGHVDHGKSALVRALTGIDPDRLPEEKARGITIDLGFAHLDLPSPPDVQPPVTYRLGIVDVPGHEDFVKNMVAGVGSVDLALLVVAADDGWMPQTEEHLQILLYLGVTRAVIALTKIDLARDEAALRSQVGEKVAGTPFAAAALVGTSVVTVEGLSELKAALADALKDLPPPPDVGKPRLPVDRAFTVKGAGTVVTGTLTGGTIRRGQSLVLQPSGTPARVRSVQTHNTEVDSIGPGNRVALNLPDLAVDDPSHAGRANVVRRGDVITLPVVGAVGDAIDVLLERSGRLPAGSRPVKDGVQVHLHLGSGDFACRVYFVGAERALGPGARALAQLRLEPPSRAFAFAGDRFILRDWPGQQTLAGGVVLDPAADRAGARAPGRRAFLEARAGAPDDPEAYVRSELTRAGGMRAGVLAQSRFSQAQIDRAVSGLITAGAAVAAGDAVLDASWYRNLRDVLVRHIDTFHANSPEQVGLPLTGLRALAEAASGPFALFEPLLADLLGSGEFVRAGDRIRRSTFRPALPPRLQAAGERIRAALAAKPFDPPARKDLAPEPAAQKALRFLVETGDAVEIGPDVVLSAEAYRRAVEAIRQHLREKGDATVSELKPVLGVSRRIMVPLLERLDRDGVTVRRGNVRSLKA